MKIQSTNKHSILLFYLLTIIFLVAGCSLPNKTISTPPVQHTLNAINSNPTWSKDSIYVVWNGFSPMLGAAQGEICFLGGLASTVETNLICLNSLTGDLLLQVASGAHTAFHISADGVYVAYSGNTGVRKYDFNGQVVWSQGLLGNGSVYLQSFNNQIHILVTPDTYYSLNKQTGELDYKIKNQNIIFQDDKQFITYLSDLRAYSIINQKLAWVTDLDDVLELAPLFTNDILLLRSGRVIGTVYAIERITGRYLWKTEKNVISTIAYSPSSNKVYIFSSEGNLIEIDINDGEETVIAEFRNQNFLLNGDAQVGGYELSYDENNKVLFLYLGDSRQLLTFQLK